MRQGKTKREGGKNNEKREKMGRLGKKGGRVRMRKKFRRTLRFYFRRVRVGGGYI